jgi:cell division protein FtsW
MYSRSTSFDKSFLILTGILLFVGLLSFLSGAFYLFSDNSAIFWSTILRHFGFGALGGLVAFVCYKLLRPKHIMKLAPYVAVISLVVAAMVFVPGLGTDQGKGALRWVEIAGFAFQPAEFLKIGLVLGVGWWLAVYRDRTQSLLGGLVPFWVILGVSGALLLLQPDTDGFLVIAAALLAMYFFAGAPWRHILVSGVVVVVVASGLLLTRPYLRQRVETFINPAHDKLGASYQVRQSLVALGSGGVTGRGYGKGIHKYEYLPEPMGDAIFAVIGEEWGLFGTASVVVLFFLWYVRALVLAARSTVYFSRFVLFGFAHIVLIQAYVNILSSVGLFPFSGLPLPFMSQGGTALFVMIVIVGIMGSLMNTSSNTSVKNITT